MNFDTINKEFEDWVLNGDGDRTVDQIVILKSYQVLLDDMSFDNLLNVTEFYEQAYNAV